MRLDEKFQLFYLNNEISIIVENLKAIHTFDKLYKLEKATDLKKFYGKGPIMKKTILITIAFSIVAAALFNGCKSKKQSVKDTGTKKTLDFALKNYDGNTVKLSDYKGQIVVLEWFNYECPFSDYH